MTYSSEVLADSPLLYWRLGESSGTTAADASGNGRTGTYSGSPTLGVASLQASDSDTAVTFDGINDVVSGAAPATTSAFTIEFLIKGNGSLTAGNMLAHRYPSTSGQRIFYVAIGSGGSSGKVEFSVRNNAATEASAFGATILGSTTRHIACTYDGTTSRIYVNGTLDGSSTVVTGVLANVAPSLEIAARTAAPVYTQATFDEVALYNTALSGARIAAHVAAMSPPAPITIHPNKITSTGTVHAPAIVPYIPPPADGNINITAELTPATKYAACIEPDRSAQIEPARHVAGVNAT